MQPLQCQTCCVYRLKCSDAAVQLPLAAEVIADRLTNQRCSEDEIHIDLSKRMASSPLTMVKGKAHNYVDTVNIPSSLNMITDMVMLLKSSMDEMQSELTALRKEKNGGLSNFWNHINSFLNSSKQDVHGKNRTVINQNGSHTQGVTNKSV